MITDYVIGMGVSVVEMLFRIFIAGVGVALLLSVIVIVVCIVDMCRERKGR